MKIKKNYTPIHRTLHRKEDPTTEKIKTIVFFIVGFSLYFFVYMNTFASQSVPQLYYSFVNEDQNASLDMLRHIRFLSQYDSILAMQENIYGKQFSAEVDKAPSLRSKNIQVLEGALKKNPKAREVLYELSVLYHENRDPIRSSEYLQRAKELDPMLK